MKKALLTILIAALLLGCGAPAFAAINLPGNLTVIGEEAFMNASLDWMVTIPDGVKSIGARAFAGSGAGFAFLPDTVTKIASNAFDRDMTFEVLPGSYAERWCRNNGFDYDIIRVYILASTTTVYPGASTTIFAGFPYPRNVNAYRWETSTDGRTWRIAAGEVGDKYTISYADRPKAQGASKLYVRCRALVNGVLLDSGGSVELRFQPNELRFEKCGALNADSIYLQWTDMGPGAVYYLQQVVNGKWEHIAQLDEKNYYTVYGLERNTDYRFTVVALVPNGRGGFARFETEDGIDLTTATSGETEVELTRCQTFGTALFLEWTPLERAVYDIALGKEGEELQYIAMDWTSSDLSYYVLEPNTVYNIVVIAWVPDQNLQSGWRSFTSGLWRVPTGSADPRVELLEPVVRGETVSLSWSELTGTKYAVYMRKDGGKEKLVGETENTHFDVGGLDRSAQYSFRVKAYLGSWSSFSAPVTVKAFPAENEVEYRALLVGEVNFFGDQYAPRNYSDVQLLDSMLSTARTPTGSRYSTLRRKDLGKAEMLAAIREAFGDADENDVSLFFLATHGDTDEIGREAGSLLTVDSGGKEESLRLEELAAALSEVRGTVIVWLGSCGSGAAIYEQGEPQNGDEFNAAAVAAFAAVDSAVTLDSAPAEDFTGGDTATFERGEFRQSKFYVLTAARYHQMSWGRTNGFNYFPLFIRDGVSTDSTGFMAADINRDGRLTQHELFLYIKACEEDPAYPIDQDVQEYPRNSNYVLFVS